MDGPYTAVLGADTYTALQEANEQGYPVLDHIQRLVGGMDNIVWAPAIEGAYLVGRWGTFLIGPVWSAWWPALRDPDSA